MLCTNLLAIYLSVFLSGAILSSAVALLYFIDSESDEYAAFILMTMLYFITAIILTCITIAFMEIDCY